MKKYIRSTSWYDAEDPNWTIDDEKGIYFDSRNASYYEAEDWAYYLGSLLKLNYYDYTTLLEDLRNLRGDEWVESAEHVLSDDELLQFKRFVHFYDEDLDKFYGYNDDEL